MSFMDNVGGYLGLPTKMDLELLQEKVAVQELLLSESTQAIPSTWLSSQARESKKVEDITGLVNRRVPVRSL